MGRICRDSIRRCGALCLVILVTGLPISMAGHEPSGSILPSHLMDNHTQLVSAHPVTPDLGDEVPTLKRVTHALTPHTAAPLASRASDGLAPSGHSDGWMTFIATWYSPQGGVGDGQTTATGTRVREGWTVAVDPSVVPLGSEIEVVFPNGTAHVYHAEDTGGAIRGRRIDIFCLSEQSSQRHGVQAVRVRILKSR